MKFFLTIFIFSPLTLVGCDSSNIQVKSSNSELSKYQKDAENGDPVAQYNMGVVYQQGLSGEKVDLDKAVYWFEKAAKRGEEDAKYNLGVIYISDNSKYRNVKKAMEIFLEGMGKNDAESINQLGIIYKDGIDTSVDNTKALSLFKQAANLGSNSAQFNLGIMYFKDKVLNKILSKLENGLKEHIKQVEILMQLIPLLECIMKGEEGVKILKKH